MEIIGECPEENVEAAKERLSTLMTNAAKPNVVTPFKCDSDSFYEWYSDVYAAEIKKEYDGLLKSGLSEDIAVQKLYDNHIESLPEYLNSIIFEQENSEDMNRLTQKLTEKQEDADMTALQDDYSDI